MLQARETILIEYFQKVSKANKEAVKKELFKILLVRLFGDDKEINEIIDKMSLGAEKTVFNIPVSTGIKTGSADTQYNRVIIEFENDLTRTGEHAKEQLAEYIAGNWKSGEDYNFTLIATDCLKWIVYSPTTESMLFNKNKLKASDIQLSDIDSFELTEINLDNFPFFLDRYLFKTEKVKANLNNFTTDFGDKSQLLYTCIGIMKIHFLDSEDSELKVAYENWEKFLSVAYGKFDATREVFFVHTFLSVFSKILAYTIITKDIYIDESELKGIVKGTIFDKHNVRNFVDDDFFHWVSSKENFKLLKPVFRQITQKIDEYDFNNVDEDILKGIYQELIDLETRHALGEYYTPDWLCTKIVGECEFDKYSKVLDPACGSGSFLLAAINKLRTEFPKLTASELTSRVVGIDIHPLSVQISKTTILIALGDKISELKEPISLRVYLANSLIIPDESVELFKNTYKMLIDKKQYEVDTTIFNDSALFDNATTLCNDLAEYSLKSKPISKEDFNNHFETKKLSKDLDDSQLSSFYKIYQGFKEAKESGRDNIWKFILQNLYKPFFLKEQFDFVIGNPPWITYSSFANSAYQKTLYGLADKYNLLPKSKKDMPHLEIASIFLSYCSSYFLKRDKGKIVFVLPRSFLSASQHDNTRLGKARGFKISEIWDLDGVSPLFRIPSMVLFADKHPWSNKNPRNLPASGLDGYKVSGRLSGYNASLKKAKDLFFKKVKWYYSKLGEISALTNRKIEVSSKGNYYEPKFKQGATIVPRNFYFVEPEQNVPKDYKNRLIQFKTSESILEDAKKPWKDFLLKGRVKTNFLFKTTLSKNIIPFALVNPHYVLLPIKIVVEDNIKKIYLLSSKDIFNLGELETANWFKEVEKLWNKNKTEKSDNMTSNQRLNFQRGLTDQNLNEKFLVLYSASAKDANAVVINRDDYDFEIIVESKAYWFATDNLNEANYITCFLNCSYTNELIKDFQSRGLFGARDVHKKILEIPFDRFNKSKEKHNRLAELGEICKTKTAKLIGDTDDFDLKSRELGDIRLKIREHLKKEISEINKLVKEIVEAKAN